MATIFTKIVNGEIPCYKIAETDEFLAFLDVNPNCVGHTLCIPKKEVNKLFDLDDATYLGLMRFTKMVAKAVAQAIPCERVGISVIGLEVPHVHVHVIPLQTMDDIRFMKKVPHTPEDFERVAKAIIKAL